MILFWILTLTWLIGIPTLQISFHIYMLNCEIRRTEPIFYVKGRFDLLGAIAFWPITIPSALSFIVFHFAFSFMIGCIKSCQHYFLSRRLLDTKDTVVDLFLSLYHLLIKRIVIMIHGKAILLTDPDSEIRKLAE